MLFARFAVFAGGARLDAIETVVFGADDATDPLDAIASLVDKSLIRQESEPRRRVALPHAEHDPRIRDGEARRARRG